MEQIAEQSTWALRSGLIALGAWLLVLLLTDLSRAARARTKASLDPRSLAMLETASGRVLHWRLYTILGFGLLLAPAPGSLARRMATPSSRHAETAESSRPRTGGSPPPLPSVPGRESSQSPSAHPLFRIEGSFHSNGSKLESDALRSDSELLHPAMHSGRGTRTRIDGPLFARGGRPVASHLAPTLGFPRSKELSMLLHPSGRSESGDDGRNTGPREERVKPGASASSPNSRTDRDRDESEGCSARRHLVREGETLWSIAADVLATDDIRRIARYWPQIHRANREIIGSDPNLLFPRQLLVLPPECDA